MATVAQRAALARRGPWWEALPQLNAKLECRIMSEKRKENSGESLPWPSFFHTFSRVDA
jgi:hypothetical protein